MNGFCYEGKMIHDISNIKRISTLSDLEEARERETVLEAICTKCDEAQNLYVSLGKAEGIIPKKEAALGVEEGRVKDIALISRVGKPVQFIIKGFEKKNAKPFALLSRKAVQERCKREYLDGLCCGDVIEAKITHLERFGAFADIGAGLHSLIPIDMLSVSRISHPSKRVREGEVLRCVVKNRENAKITLSLRELLGTWEENAALFCAGQTVKGIVRGVEEYGVFIELTPNLAGLAEFNPALKEGQEVSVYIKAIIPEKMKIKLSVIDVLPKSEEQALQLFFDGNHMDYWRYSPLSCEKLIESRFDERCY